MIIEKMRELFDTTPEKYVFIDSGKLFVEGAVNVIYGEKAAGKTYSLLKYLRGEGIVPIFVDFDRNEVDTSTVHYFKGSGKLMEFLEENDTEGNVIIVDHLDGFSNGKYMTEDDATVVVNRLSKLGTIILLAHATAYRSSTRKSLAFRGNDKIVNNALTVYRIENEDLHIEKNRSIDTAVLKQWMRDV